MPMDELRKLSREAAKRASAAIAAAKAEGPGWGPRSRETTAAPLAEIGAYSRAMEKLRKIDEGIGDRQHRLYVVRLDSTRPPDVKRQQLAEMETGIVDLKTARNDLETEVRATLLPAAPDAADTQDAQGDPAAPSAGLPAPPAGTLAIADTDDAGLPAPPRSERELIGDTDDAGLVDPEARKRQAIAETDNAGWIDPTEKAKREKRQAIADMDDAGSIDPETQKRRAVAATDDAGLASLADSVLDIDEMAALEPKTYGESRRYAKAITEIAGIRDEELQGLESEMTRDKDGMPRDVSGSDTLPADARESYDRFVKAALERRNSPLVFPRTKGGVVDIWRVQPGFVYKTGDGVLFMLDKDRRNFVEARKRRTPDAGGGLYEPVAGGESVSTLDMLYRAKGRGKEVTHRIPATEQGKVIVPNLDKRVIYEVEDGRTFRWDGEEFREVRRLAKPDEHGRAFAPIPDQRTSSRTADWAMPISPHGRSVRSEAEAIAEHARIVAEQAGRGGHLATMIGTRAREIADFRRKYDYALSFAKRNNIDINTDPEVRNTRNAYRREMNRLRSLQNELMEEVKPEALTAEEMAGRMDDPGRVENAVNSGVQGGGEVLASIPIFIAVSKSKKNRRLNIFWNEVDSGKIPNDFLERPPLHMKLHEFGLISLYHRATPEEKKVLRRRYADPDPRTTDLYRWGMNLREALQEQFETNPRYADEFFATKLPAALGKTMTEGIIVGGAQIIGIPAPVSKGVLGMMTESSGLFLEALENDMPIDKAYQEFGFGALLGMTKGIPIADFVGGITNKKAESEIRAALIKAMISGTQEAALEGVEQIRGIAKEYKLADGEEIAAAFTAEAINEFALALIKPGG